MHLLIERLLTYKVTQLPRQTTNLLGICGEALRAEGDANVTYHNSLANGCTRAACHKICDKNMVVKRVMSSSGQRQLDSIVGAYDTPDLE